MAIDIEVIFTGLCLFCLNTPGSMCAGEPSGFVYLVNGTEDAKVCGHQLDGGHRPRIAFDEEFLLPGSRQDHTVEPSPDGHRVVVSSLQGIELCIRTEQPPQSGSQGAASLQPTSGGAKPVAEPPIGNRKRPWPFFNDADSFDWIVDLTDMSEEAKSLCPQVNGPLADNKLVTASSSARRGRRKHRRQVARLVGPVVAALVAAFVGERLPDLERGSARTSVALPQGASRQGCVAHRGCSRGRRGARGGLP